MIKVFKYVFVIMILFASKLGAAALRPDEEALVRAAAAGDATTVTALLSRDVNPNVAVVDGGAGSNPLTEALVHMPSTRGHMDVIRVLLNAGASRASYFPTGSPLHIAVASNNIEAARILMYEFGFNPLEPIGGIFHDVTSITIAERSSEAMRGLVDPWFKRHVAVIAGAMFN